MLGNVVTGVSVMAPAGMLGQLSEVLGITIREAGLLVTFGAVVHFRVAQYLGALRWSGHRLCHRRHTLHSRCLRRDELCCDSLRYRRSHPDRADKAACGRKLTQAIVDAAPASIAPRKIPPRISGLGGRHVVDTGCAPRLAAQQTRQRHPSTSPQAELRDGLIAIDRTCRKVPAVVADERRERMPINPDQSAPCIAWQAMKCATASGTVRRMTHLILVAFPSFVESIGAELTGSFPRNWNWLSFAPHLANIAQLGLRRSKSVIDADRSQGYFFITST